MTAITINFNSIIKLTEDQLYDLCRANPDLKFERNSKGEIVIVPPTGGETGKYNAGITADFVIWNRQAKLGVVFDSSTCFHFPNGADRSPDVAWIKQELWDALTQQQQEKFPPIAPDFVLELMSPTDRLKETQAKMQEDMANGVKLGWLINRKIDLVEIYRQGKAIEVLENPTDLSGEDVLPGFILNLENIWK
jgi:Uma2 family endonuclease